MTGMSPAGQACTELEAMTSNQASPRVLVFDSGVGGLSIAQCIRQRLPASELVYLADNALFPYGELPEERVIERCVSLIVALLEREPVDIIVIGCNTASTVVLEPLRARLTQPVVGVVPAIKPAAELSPSGRIGLLATPATVRRAYLDDLIERFAGHCQVTRVGSSELVREAEHWLGGEALDSATIDEVLAPLRESAVDTVVLGCTHFPLIADALAASMPASVQWIDSGDAIARRVENLWRTIRQAQSPPGVRGNRLYFTAEAPSRLAAYLADAGFSSPVIQGNWSPGAD